MDGVENWGVGGQTWFWRCKKGKKIDAYKEREREGERVIEREREWLREKMID